MVNQEHLKILVSADVKELNAGLNTASTNLKSFGDKLTGIGKNLSTKLSLPIVLAGAAAVKSASDFERLQTSLGVLTGSAEAGAIAFERLVKFSAQTPFQLKDLANVNNQLIGFGMTSDQAFNSLKLLGDVSAVAGADLSRVAVAFGQSSAAGRVMTQDLNQFVNNGIPIFQLLGDVTGKNAGQIRDMASEGNISFELLNQAFIKATSAGGRFENGMEKLSRTFAGQFSTLKDNLNIALAEFGKILLPILKNTLASLTKLIQKFAGLSPKLKEGILRFGALAAILPPLLIVLGTIATAIGAISAPIAIAIVAVSALVIFFDDIVEAGENLRNFLQSKLNVLLGKAAEKFELLGNEVNRYGTILREVLTKGFSADISSINQKFDEQAESIKNLNKVEVDVVETKKQDQNETKKLTNRTVELKKAIDEVRVPIKSIGDEFLEKQKATEKTAESLKIYREALGGASYSIKENINITTKATNADLAHILALKEKADQNQQMLLQSRLQAEGLNQIFTVLDNNLQAIAETVGGVLVQSFEALLTGGDFFKTLIDGLKRLIIKLIAAAAAAFVLNSILSAVGLAKVPNVGAMFSAFAGFSSMPAIEFANGGIVSGPTLGLFGEYSGARANPEVVAPLDKLKGMIGNQTGGNVNVTGEFRLKGQDLVVALQRANKQRNRIL